MAGPTWKPSVIRARALLSQYVEDASNRVQRGEAIDHHEEWSRAVGVIDEALEHLNSINSDFREYKR